MLRPTEFFKYILCPLVLFASSLALSQTEPVDAPPSTPPNQPIIVVLGDSLSAAYNIPVAQGWVALLATKLRERGYSYEVINESISGDTTGGGLERLSDILRRHRVSILILELGGNDGLRGYPLGVMKNNLTQIIQQTTQTEAKVLLVGTIILSNYGARYRQGFENAYAQVADQEKVAFVPDLLQNVPKEEEYFLADRLHPGIIAQPLIMETIWQMLVRLL